MKTIEEYQKYIKREIKSLLPIMDLAFSSIDSIKNIAKKEKRELTEDESKDIEDLERLICTTDNEIKDYESKISFYAFFGIDNEGNTTNRAFYDLEEARQEAEFWVEDNEGKGHYAIFLSVTTEEEVRELLKGFSKQFLESHEEFQNPRDEYTLSHVSNADMVVEELVSTF